MGRTKYDIEGSFGSIVRRADTALIKRLNRNFQDAGFEITTEQYRILVNLWNADGQSQQALAAATGKNKAGITRLVNGLERKRLVKRVASAADSRHKNVYLTPQGRRLPKQLAGLARRTLREALAGIPAEKVCICRAVLLAVLDNLQALPEPERRPADPRAAAGGRGR